ncbi:MAG TPA: hypothetical protein VLM39_06880 [Ignavibacteriaceae bacterium]|nr:hypothetical protein [Ignavibacteriaceae bacterium]
MYLQTLLTSALDTENAAAESCHLILPVHSLFSFINRSELSDIIVDKYSSDNFEEREIMK